MMRISTNIYGKYNPQDVPAYNLAEVARYLHIATATLRSWVFGRTYPRGDKRGFFAPLIELPDTLDGHLSFNNLIEAYVLRALRIEHGVAIRKVRIAREYAEKRCRIQHLLLRPELRTTAGDLFLDKYGQLVNLSLAGQMALRKILKDHLKRVEWKQDIPFRLYPDLRDRKKIIAIDPSISFGRPVIIRKGVSTAVIADRIDAGESVMTVAKDYDLKRSEIETAVLYERAA